MMHLWSVPGTVGGPGGAGGAVGLKGVRGPEGAGPSGELQEARPESAKTWMFKLKLLFRRHLAFILEEF